MNKKVIVLSILIILLGLGGIFVCNKLSNKKSLNEIDISVDIDNGDEDIDWDNFDNHNIKLEKSITIDSEGIYNLTGNINDGSLIVDTDSYVKLVLNNVNINNKSGPAIIIEKAKSVVIELSEGSINKLSDGSNYDNEDYSGCIFSRSDLIFNGNGTLNLVSHYLDGIVSVDDLKFISGKYVIDSNDDGIRGKDSVNIINGEFIINSKNDGIKSNNEFDKNKGFVNIVNGKFDINSEGDGIQAFNKLIIYDGEFVVNSGNGELLGKSLKSDGNIFINNGKFELVSNDDCIHTNKSFMINKGFVNVTSLDDGIHSDDSIIINDGIIYIDALGDGIDGNGSVIINDGKIYIDGNANDGNSVIAYDIDFFVNGGSVVAVYSGKMKQEISDKLKLYSISFDLEKAYNGEMKLLDKNGKVLINYTPLKDYKNVIIIGEYVKKKHTYSLEINEEVVDKVKVN